MSKSLIASRDHVFVTWHDIYFDVPIKKQKKNADNQLYEINDDRVNMIKQHY